MISIFVHFNNISAKVIRKLIAHACIWSVAASNLVYHLRYVIFAIFYFIIQSLGEGKIVEEMESYI